MRPWSVRIRSLTPEGADVMPAISRTGPTLTVVELIAHLQQFDPSLHVTIYNPAGRLDLHCPVCGEPWDFDSLHENDRGLPFDEAYRLFRSKGCGAVFDVTCLPADTARTHALADLADLLGDDADGYAALVEDFGLDDEP